MATKIDTRTMTPEGLQNYIKLVEDKLADVAAYRTPSDVFPKLQECINVTTEVRAKVNALEAQVKGLLFDAAGDVSNKDLKDLFARSKHKTKDIADHFNVTLQQANNYVNGNIEDKRIRRELKVYLIDGLI